MALEARRALGPPAGPHARQRPNPRHPHPADGNHEFVQREPRPQEGAETEPQLAALRRPAPQRRSLR